MATNTEASPGKIFVGGLDKHTSLPTFTKHFEQYGEITDIVIMRDRHTQQPRGFGFVTYSDPSVVDNVIEQTHVINGKQVEIKRTIPKGSVQSDSKDIKTKKIFVGGLPTTLTDDGFKDFFSRYGAVVEHQIIRDRSTNRSRGFGFIIFENEQVVDDILIKGNRIDMLGQQVEIKKAEPKKPSNQPPPVPAIDGAAPGGAVPGIDPRARPFGDGLGMFGGYSFSDFGGSGFGPTPPFRPTGAIGSGLGGYRGGYGGYGGSGSEFGGPYGGFGSSGLGGYRGDSSFGYSSRLGSYGGLGTYGRGDDGYAGLGGGFDSGSNSGAGGLFSSRTGYNGSSRYHPYSR